MTFADYNPTTHEIRISDAISPSSAVSQFLFELCNAVNPYFNDDNLSYIRASDFNNADDYAYAFEKAEYQSVLEYYSLVMRSCQAKYW